MNWLAISVTMHIISAIWLITGFFAYQAKQRAALQKLEQMVNNVNEQYMHMILRGGDDADPVPGR